MPFSRAHILSILDQARTSPSGVNVDFHRTALGSLAACRAESKALRLSMSSLRNEERNLARTKEGRVNVLVPMDNFIFHAHDTETGTRVHIRYGAAYGTMLHGITITPANPEEVASPNWPAFAGQAMAHKAREYEGLDEIIRTRGGAVPHKPVPEKAPSDFEQLSAVPNNVELDFGS